MLTRLVFYSLVLTNPNETNMTLVQEGESGFESTCETYLPTKEAALDSVEDKTEDMTISMAALELFLMDQKHHREFCSSIAWKQPTMDEYKLDLRSHLPESCLSKIPSSASPPPPPPPVVEEEVEESDSE